MPKNDTIRRARDDARQKKSPSTQAGEFVREEIKSIRAGEHGARSARQAIAIGLSKARRAGVKLPPPKPGRAPAAVRRKAQQDLAAGDRREAPSRARSRAAVKALQREPQRAASPTALSRQARAAAKKRGGANRRRAAQKAVATRRKNQRS